ncbi:hypothetical protein QJS66_17670 [Kocuria rhizophila]|nr:hypothetical protein QJS66_17670 [Kocuria rhizophila]
MPAAGPGGRDLRGDAWTHAPRPAPGASPGPRRPGSGARHAAAAAELPLARFPDYPRGITCRRDRGRPPRAGGHQRLPRQITEDFATERTAFHREAPRTVARRAAGSRDDGRRSASTPRSTMACTRCGFAGSQQAYDAAYERRRWPSTGGYGGHAVLPHGGAHRQADVRRLSPPARASTVYAEPLQGLRNKSTDAQPAGYAGSSRPPAPGTRWTSSRSRSTTSRCTGTSTPRHRAARPRPLPLGRRRTAGRRCGSPVAPATAPGPARRGSGWPRTHPGLLTAALG